MSVAAVGKKANEKPTTTLGMLWAVRDLADDRLSPKHRAVLFSLVAFRGGEGRICPSISQLSESTGYCRSAVITALNELASFGLIKRTSGKGRRLPNAYALCLSETPPNSEMVHRVDVQDVDVHQMDGGSPPGGLQGSTRWTGVVHQVDTLRISSQDQKDQKDQTNMSECPYRDTSDGVGFGSHSWVSGDLRGDNADCSAGNGPPSAPSDDHFDLPDGDRPSEGDSGDLGHPTLFGIPSSDPPPKKPKRDARIGEVWEHYLGVWRRKVGSGREPELTRTRQSQISARLRRFDLDDVRTAIDNLFESSFHRGDNDRGQSYLGIEYVTRSDEKLEAMLAKRASSTTRQAPAEDEYAPWRAQWR